MKKYYDPKMNIIAFDSDEKIVTSGIKEWEEAYGDNVHTIEFIAMSQISNYVNMGE